MAIDIMQKNIPMYNPGVSSFELPDYDNKNIAVKSMADPDKPLKPATPQQMQVGKAASWGIYNTVKNNTPYQLSEGAIKAGNKPELTCIGGACELYKNLGIDFSGLGSESEGVRQSRTGGMVVEYNPTFAKNYAKAGFDLLKGRSMNKNEVSELVKNQYLQPGDLIQYVNEKGVPDHTNVVYKINPDGTYQVYNAFKHSTVNYKGSKEDYVYNLNPNASNKKINIYRISEEKANELAEKDKSTLAMNQAGAARGINDDVETMRDKIIGNLKNMSQSDLKTYYGVYKYTDIPEDLIKKEAIESVKKQYMNLTNPESYSFNSSDPERAKNSAIGYSKLYKILSSSDDWGTPIKYYNDKNLRDKYGEKK
jgi:hypothetical protein